MQSDGQDVSSTAHNPLAQYLLPSGRIQPPDNEALLLSNDSSRLSSQAICTAFWHGTGAEIIDSICTTIEQAEHEVMFVTCFWAKSESQRRVARALRELACRARDDNRLVKAYICFSSLSLLQKLLHSCLVDGQRYSSKTWPKRFGLPLEQELLFDTAGSGAGQVGVSLEIKSIFLLPFSVLHTKFVIVDRQQAFLPSCNVSWEEWFEGCLVFRGPIVEHFVHFFHDVWQRRKAISITQTAHTTYHNDNSRPHGTTLPSSPIPALFLPSPHHRNPRFRPTRLLSAPKPPATLLNTFLVNAISSSAKQEIFMQTPNLTCPAVLQSILSALSRGVNVSILTSERMMRTEQLLTAGTTTERCVSKLVHQYTASSLPYNQIQRNGNRGRGKLSIRFFHPQIKHEILSGPSKTHLKLTIIDNAITILGSGNMDRASWYTSQEVDLAVWSGNVAGVIRNAVLGELRERGCLGEEIVPPPLDMSDEGVGAIV